MKATGWAATELQRLRDEFGRRHGVEPTPEKVLDLHTGPGIIAYEYAPASMESRGNTTLGVEPWIERPLKIFRVGRHISGGRYYSLDDLREIAAHSRGSDGEGGGVPIQIRHNDDPRLTIGRARELWVDGEWSWGIGRFTGADNVRAVRNKQFYDLSAGIDLSSPRLQLDHIAVVTSPAVEGAAIHSKERRKSTMPESRRSARGIHPLLSVERMREEFARAHGVDPEPKRAEPKRGELGPGPVSSRLEAEVERMRENALDQIPASEKAQEQARLNASQLMDHYFPDDPRRSLIAKKPAAGAPTKRSAEQQKTSNEKPREKPSEEIERLRKEFVDRLNSSTVAEEQAKLQASGLMDHYFPNQPRRSLGGKKPDAGKHGSVELGLPKP